MDKWFEEQFGETFTNTNHHAEVLKCNIDTFEKNTTQQTHQPLDNTKHFLQLLTDI